MDTDTSEDAGGPAILSGNEVMEAQFKVHDATEKGEPAKKLYLKTFELIDRDILLWQERPESEWPLLATILPNSIVMYPIHANPHTKRYLTPKHGRFKTVIYEDDADGTLPKRSTRRGGARGVETGIQHFLINPVKGLASSRILIRFGRRCR